MGRSLSIPATVCVDEFNAQAEALAGRYGGGFEVCRLQKAPHRGLLVRYCLWPNFAPVVMPFCDVVALTGVDLVDGKRSRQYVVGCVSQQALLDELGERVARRRPPARHLVIERELDGDGQYRLGLHVHPDPAASELLEEA